MPPPPPKKESTSLNNVRDEELSGKGGHCKASVSTEISVNFFFTLDFIPLKKRAPGLWFRLKQKKGLTSADLGRQCDGTEEYGNNSVSLLVCFI